MLFSLRCGEDERGDGYFVGTHDFFSLCSQKTQASSTIRTIYSLDILQDEDMITIVVRDDLRHYIRILAGTLIKVGMGVSTGGTCCRDFVGKESKIGR